MNRLEDFEWRELGFDEHIFTHKTRNMTLAGINHFGGWRLRVLLPSGGTTQIGEVIDSLEAAKTIAMIHIHQNFGDYPNAYRYSHRTTKPRPEEVPAGVFKMDRVRR